jgi:3-oxoacyl-[acyl-carrier protein] reductase
MGAEAGTALITGGGSGIGLAITRALLDRGWRVAICGRDRDKLERAATQLTNQDSSFGERLLWNRVNVSRNQDVQLWVNEVCRRFGAPSLLVNNAGIGVDGRISALSEDEWDRVQDTNLKGAFLCTREVLPRMREHGTGMVINIASLAGKQGFAGSSAYCASKFGLVGFTESLVREEAAHGIRATSICPAFVATPMVAEAEVPAEEMIQPEDIARSVLFLLDLSPNVVIREIVVERTWGL